MEVLATYYIEEFDTNLLLIIDENTNYILIMVIGDCIYVNRELNVGLKVGHENNSLTIEVQKNAQGCYYYNYKVVTESNTDTNISGYFNHFYNHINMFSPIFKFVNENKELFVPDGRPILK